MQCRYRQEKNERSGDGVFWRVQERGTWTAAIAATAKICCTLITTECASAVVREKEEKEKHSQNRKERKKLRKKKERKKHVQMQKG